MKFTWQLLPSVHIHQSEIPFSDSKSAKLFRRENSLCSTWWMKCVPSEGQRKAFPVLFLKWSDRGGHCWLSFVRLYFSPLLYCFDSFVMINFLASSYLCHCVQMFWFVVGLAICVLWCLLYFFIYINMIFSYFHETWRRKYGNHNNKKWKYWQRTLPTVSPHP